MSKKQSQFEYLETGQKATEEQVAAWKEKYGEVFLLSEKIESDLVGEDLLDSDLIESQPSQAPGVRYLYVRKPSDVILEHAAKRTEKEGKGNKRFTELVLKNIWLAGHRDFLEDSGAMMSIGRKIEELMGLVELDMEKL